VRRRHMARPIRAMVFLALALGAVTMALGDGARRVALVIGNGAYEKGALPNPVNDATDVAASLRASGFEVILRTDLRLSQMEQIVREFGDGVQRGDVALFYYAGHGLESGGANYLIPVDNGSLLREEEIRYKAMDAELVLDSVAGGGAGLSIVILDAQEPEYGDARTRSDGCTRRDGGGDRLRDRPREHRDGRDRAQLGVHHCASPGNREARGGDSRVV
jgi:hypothetical protein